MSKYHKPPKVEAHGTIKVWCPANEGEGYSISYGGGGWMPGSYDSVESAIMGGKCCFKDESKFVSEIQQPVNHFDKENRLITLDDMKSFLSVTTTEPKR